MPATAFLQIKAGGDGTGLKLFDPVREPPAGRRFGPTRFGDRRSLFHLALDVLSFPALASQKGYMNTALCRSAISYIDGDKVRTLVRARDAG